MNQEVEKQGQIGNKSGDEYSLCCVYCGINAALQQVAFRNTQGKVIGYVFTCRICEKKIFGETLAEILGYLPVEEAHKKGWVSPEECKTCQQRQEYSDKILYREAAFEEERLRGEVEYWKDKNYRLGG